MRTKILAIILAGGEGGRMEVLTERRAKPALPFAGVYRLIDFSLSNCLHSNIGDVWIIEQYEPHSLNEHLANGRPWDLDRTYGGLQVLPPYQRRNGEEGGFAEGNADALYRHCGFIRDFDPDLLLVLSADHVYRLDYNDVLDRHREVGAGVTLVTTRVPKEEACRFGVVEVDGEGRVTGFEYKPEEPRNDLVTTEIFVYDARKLLDTLERLAGELGEGESLSDFGHALLPAFVEEGSAWEHRFEGYWRDVGTIDSYWEGHMDLLDEKKDLGLDEDEWPILTYGTPRLPARIEAPARIEGSLVSAGCRISGRVVRSVLGPGVVVEEGAEVRDSVLLHDAVVRAGAAVERSILDDRVEVGEGARVGGPDAITLAGEETRIEPGARIEAGGRVTP